MRKLMRSVAKERLAILGVPKRDGKRRSTFPRLWREVIFGKSAEKARQKQVGRD